MNKTKVYYTVEIAYDLLSKVHSFLCNNTSRNADEGIVDDTLEILRQILILRKKLRRVKLRGDE